MRAEAEGFVEQVLARDGDTVAPGTPLAVLAEPSLIAERDTLRARLLGLTAGSTTRSCASRRWPET